MEPLDPKARALVQASRSALRPTAADRERIDALLRARLGLDVLPPSEADVQPIARAARWQGVAGIAAGVSVLGALSFLALRPAPDARTPYTRSLAPSSAQVPPTAAEPSAPDTTAPAMPELPSAPSTPHTTSLVPHPPDRLAREVALLSKATSELRAGRAASALKVLAEHQRRFPRGALSEERWAAKAQALCQLGHMREGRAELAHLTPESPAAVRAEQLCDAASSARQ